MDTRFRPGDVPLGVLPEAIRGQGVNALAREDADWMAATIRELFVEGAIDRDIAGDIVPVGAVHAAPFQPPRSQEPDQLVGKHDVDIGCQNELAPRAADTDILGNHLVQGQSHRVPVAGMYFGRHFEDTHLARAGVAGPPTDFSRVVQMLYSWLLCRWHK